MVGKRFGVQSPPTPRTYWNLGLMIKNYRQEQTLQVETPKKKKKNPSKPKLCWAIMQTLHIDAKVNSLYVE